MKLSDWSIFRTVFHPLPSKERNRTAPPNSQRPNERRQTKIEISCVLLKKIAILYVPFKKL